MRDLTSEKMRTYTRTHVFIYFTYSIYLYYLFNFIILLVQFIYLFTQTTFGFKCFVPLACPSMSIFLEFDNFHISDDEKIYEAARYVMAQSFRFFFICLFTYCFQL